MSVSTRRLSYVFPCLAILTAIIFTGCPFCVTEVDILVSPQTILLGENQGGEVSVHTEIAYNSVDTDSLELNRVPAMSAGSDAPGDLVAKFPEDAIKALVAPPSAVLTMTGATLNGGTFTGSDEVKVRRH